MKRFKSLSALFLALVLAFSLSVPAFAASENDTISSIKYVSEAFTIDSNTYTNGNTGESFTAYSCSLESANATNSVLANMPLTVTYSGGTLKNGTTTYTGGGTVTTYVNVINRVAELTLTGTNGVTETYYISAWKTGSTFYASVSVEFENAYAFSQTAVNTKYKGANTTQNPYMQATTATQKTTAQSAYDTTKAAFNGSTSATYSGLSYGYTAADIITAICNAKGVYISNSSGYISQIGDLNDGTAGKYVHPQWGGPYNSGGWMFKVLRGSDELYPSISAGSFRLLAGDVVTWQYTADVGYDLGVPMF